MASRGAWRQGHASRLRLDNASLQPQLAQLIQSVAVRLDPCRRTPPEGLCVGSSVRAWTRGVSFFGSGVPFRVPRRHVVVFSARKRQNRRFGAGGEGDAAFEFAKRFSRPGLSLGAMVLKDLKPPHLCLRPAPNRNILRFRARFPTRWPEAGAFPVVDKLPHLLSTKIRGAVCPRIFIGSVVGGKFWR